MRTRAGKHEGDIERETLQEAQQPISGLTNNKNFYYIPTLICKCIFVNIYI